MEKISLYDVTTVKVYDIMLSPADSHRAYSDSHFATSLLHAKILEEKNKNKILHVSSTHDNIRTDAMPEPEILDRISEQETTPTLHNDQQLDDCEESCLYRWTEACVLLLLRTYEMEEKFNSGKISHKKCWELVAEVLKNEGYNYTGPQCSSKFRSLKKTYKSIKDHNFKSGNDRRTWQHFEIMDNMFSKKAWCKPVALASSTGQMVKNINTEDFSTSSDLSLNDSFDEKENKLSKKRKNTKTSMMDLLEQRLMQKEEHEKKRQKRHDDKILLETKLIDTLNQILNK